MRNFDINELKAGINRTLDDTGNPIISCGTIAGYGWSDFDKIRTALKTWEADGDLKILNDPEGKDRFTPCVEMLRYIQQRSSIPGFLNWEE